MVWLPEPGCEAGARQGTGTDCGAHATVRVLDEVASSAFILAPRATHHSRREETRPAATNTLTIDRLMPAERDIMWKDFKAFLVKQNMLALAIAVVIGAATNDVIQALVNDFIMPVINAVLPAGGWQEASFGIGRAKFTYGHFLSVLLKFLIVGFVCWRILLLFVRPPKPDEKPATRECPFCRQSVDARASRCAYCTSDLRAVA